MFSKEIVKEPIEKVANFVRTIQLANQGKSEVLRELLKKNIQVEFCLETEEK